MRAPSLKQALILTLATTFVAAPVMLIGQPLLDTLTDSAQRWRARKAQRALAQEILSQRHDLEKRAARLEQDLDAGSLFHRDRDSATVQTNLQSAVRAAAQSAGLVVRALESRTAAEGGLRQRITLKVTAEGDFEPIYTAIQSLESYRPRLLLTNLRIHGGAKTDTSLGAFLPPLILDLEIDAYADLSGS